MLNFLVKSSPNGLNRCGIALLKNDQNDKTKELWELCDEYYKKTMANSQNREFHKKLNRRSYNNPNISAVTWVDTLIWVL